jgi:prolyl-tRNA editing enzyme YbaK/EbsC (Cys-tRNA(Pro) deacylase)
VQTFLAGRGFPSDVRELRNHEVVWAAAGTPFAVFAVDPRQLEALTGGKWVDLAEARS